MAANRIYIQVDFQQAQAVANVNTLNQAIGKIGPATQQATRQASQGVSSLSMTISQAQRSFAGIGSALAAFGAYRTGDQLLRVTADLDTLRKTLELWEGSQEKANARFEQFRQMSLKPGVSLEPAIQAYSRLMSVTKDSGESIRMIEGVGRALGQMGRGGTDLYNALEQVAQSISKRGSIMREDLKFVQQYIPQVTEILEKLYGTADTETLQQQGYKAADVWRKVTAELLKLREVEPGVGKMMEQFWQEMRLGAETAGQSLAKELKPHLADIVQLVKDLSKWWKELDPDTRRMIVDMTELGVAIAGIGLALAGVLKALTAIGAFLSANPIVLAIMTMVGAGMYVTLQAKEKGANAVVGGSGHDQGFGGMQDMFNRRERPNLPPLPAPPSPGLPMNWAANPPSPFDKPEPKPKAIPDKGAAAAALAIAKWYEDLRQKVDKGAQDALADQQKHFAEYLTAGKQLNAEIAALKIDRQKQWNDLITRVGPDGRAQIASMKEQQELMVAFAKETALRKSIIEDKWRREQIEKNRKMLEEIGEAEEEGWKARHEARTAAYSEMLQAEGRMLEDAQRQQIDNELQALEASKDRRLILLEETGNETLAQQISLAQQRLEVENEYVDKALELNLKLLDIDKQRAMFQLEAQRLMAGMAEDNPQFVRTKQALEDMYRLRREGMTAQAEDQKERNRLKTIQDQSRMIRTEMQKTFEYFERLAEGVFDALLSKSKSVTQALGDFVKQTFLTVIKALYSQMIAGILTRLVYGAPAGGGGTQGGSRGGVGIPGVGGGSSGGGPLGWLGSIISGGGRGGGFGGGWPWPQPPVIMNASGGASSANNIVSPRGGGFGGLFSGIPFIGGKGGGGGILDTLRGIGNIGYGPKGGDFGGEVAGSYRGVGGLGGAALLAGGGTLAYMGLKRGGLSGLGMTTAGGAMIGFKFGGPIGAAIGAAAGAAAGTIRLFIKGAKEKTRQRIKEIYGVDISSNGILDQIQGIVKQNYGGDMNVGLYSPQVQELVQMYKMTQGINSTQGMGRPMYPVSWAMSGGSASLQPVYSNGSLVANPYVGATTTQQSATFVQLNPQQANQLFEGRVVQVVGNNPGAVADASTSAMEPTYRRSREQNSMLEPMTAMS